MERFCGEIDLQVGPPSIESPAMASSSNVLYLSPDGVLGECLRHVARRIFTETFADLYNQEAFESFCDLTYALDGPFMKDIADPDVRWRVATFDGDPIAYAKLTPLRALAPDPQDGSLELQQIYVLKSWQGKGVAEELMSWALEAARKSAAAELYLTVFDHNERAKRFYSRHGFEEVGSCQFKLGERIDDDRVWRKLL